MKKIVKKYGNSLVVSFTKEEAKVYDIKERDVLEVFKFKYDEEAKEMRFYFIYIIFLIVGFSIGYYENMQDSKITSVTSNSEWVVNGGEFMTDSYSLHWHHMPLTYYVNGNCGSKEDVRIDKAFQIIENDAEEAVKFEEIDNETADIQVFCSIEQPLSYTDDFAYIGGLAAITNEGNKIVSAQINLYNVTDDCNYPSTEIHEILHTLGLGHTSEKNSVMNSVSLEGECLYLNSDIIDILKKLYS